MATHHCPLGGEWEKEWHTEGTGLPQVEIPSNQKYTHFGARKRWLPTTAHWEVDGEGNGTLRAQGSPISKFLPDKISSLWNREKMATHHCPLGGGWGKEWHTESTRLPHIEIPSNQKYTHFGTRKRWPPATAHWVVDGKGSGTLRALHSPRSKFLPVKNIHTLEQEKDGHPLLPTGWWMGKGMAH